MHAQHSLSCPILVLSLLTACANSPSRSANEAETAVSERNYERLKTLSGDWYLVGGKRLGKALEPNLATPFLSYSVSSGGHSVIEKLFVNQPNEMTTVYYLDGGCLMMDHYCSLGNQPRMVAVASPDREISFQLLGVGNMSDKDDLHISSHALEFHESKELTAHWGATKEQKPVSGSRYRVKKIHR